MDYFEMFKKWMKDVDLCGTANAVSSISLTHIPTYMYALSNEPDNKSVFADAVLYGRGLRDKYVRITSGQVYMHEDPGFPQEVEKDIDDRKAVREVMTA